MRRNTKKSKKTQAVESSQRRYWIWGGIGLGAIAVLGLLALGLRSPETLHGLQHYLSLSRDHNEDAVYDISNGLPPTGGEHSPQWLNCGIYNTPVEMKNAVHSLEHGAVWLTYQPDLPANKVADLQTLVRGQSYVIMSPFPDQAAPVVLTAWGLQLVIDKLPDGRIANLIKSYQQGPQTPEIGATCSGGMGEPTG